MNCLYVINESNKEFATAARYILEQQRVPAENIISIKTAEMKSPLAILSKKLEVIYPMNYVVFIGCKPSRTVQTFMIDTEFRSVTIINEDTEWNDICSKLNKLNKAGVISVQIYSHSNMVYMLEGLTDDSLTINTAIALSKKGDVS